MTGKQSPPTLIVGVGASAGGLEAFKQLLAVLPEDTGMAFLLVQHLDPAHNSLLAELLTPRTSMVVREAGQGDRVEANVVYIIRPGTALAIRGGRIEVTDPTLHRGVRLPVDHLFRSLAREYGSRSAGLVLSGAGSDGKAGVRDIKAAGGLVIAQDPESCGQPGMPQSAIDTGAIDLVLDIAQMPAALVRFERLPPRIPGTRDGQSVSARSQRLQRLSMQDVGSLAALLDGQATIDLRVYKPATIERRVIRRMTLSGFEHVERYFDHLRSNAAEQQALVRDLLISVTEFFRDPDAFEVLRQTVIQPLVSQAAPGDLLRAWVPACATGEEAYSVAMELLDVAGAQNKRPRVQVFATDVDQDALAFARAGIYPTSIAESVGERRLELFSIERTQNGNSWPNGSSIPTIAIEW